MHKYTHHLGDYAKDAGHLELIEEGAYRRLIDRYYSTEEPLPLDAVELHRIARARTPEEKAAVDQVVREFFTPAADGLRHKRIDAEIAVYSEISRKASESSEKRWRKGNPTDEGSGNAVPSDPKSGTDANAMPTQCEGNATKSGDASGSECLGNAKAMLAIKPLSHYPIKPKTRAKRAVDKSAPSVDMSPKIELKPPDGVTVELWEAFRKMRKKIKAPLTEEAEALLVAKLAKLKAEEGQDPAAVVAQSVERSWRGLFPVFAPAGASSTQAGARGGSVDRWWESSEGIVRKGTELGMTAKPGETSASFRDRINAAIERQRAAA